LTLFYEIIKSGNDNLIAIVEKE